ncbi:MAG: M15 family metallopeptidase [Janthinobacterium lividum]
MPSPFAADRLPDGGRHYSHRTVLARRALLGGILLTGVGVGVGVHHSRGDDPPGTAPATDLAGYEGSASDPAAAGPAAAGPTAPTSADATAAAPAFSLTAADSPWVVINKQHPLIPAGYVPRVLSTVGGKQVAGVIVPDLTALLGAAQADGVELTLTSGYRSHDYQRSVHDNAVEREGFAAAESYSARPGYSEHQTGLAVDFGSSTQPKCAVQDCFQGTTEAHWLAANAKRFGFLLRYPGDRIQVTGYAAESWHYRWIGVDLAQQMDRARVSTLEEFFAVRGGPDYA